MTTRSNNQFGTCRSSFLISFQIVIIFNKAGKYSHEMIARAFYSDGCSFPDDDRNDYDSPEISYPTEQKLLKDLKSSDQELEFVVTGRFFASKYCSDCCFPVMNSGSQTISDKFESNIYQSTNGIPASSLSNLPAEQQSYKDLKKQLGSLGIGLDTLVDLIFIHGFYVKEGILPYKDSKKNLENLLENIKNNIQVKLLAGLNCQSATSICGGGNCIEIPSETSLEFMDPTYRNPKSLAKTELNPLLFKNMEFVKAEPVKLQNLIKLDQAMLDTHRATALENFKKRTN